MWHSGDLLGFMSQGGPQCSVLSPSLTCLSRSLTMLVILCAIPLVHYWVPVQHGAPTQVRLAATATAMPACLFSPHWRSLVALDEPFTALSSSNPSRALARSLHWEAFGVGGGGPLLSHLACPLQDWSCAKKRAERLPFGAAPADFEARTLNVAPSTHSSFPFSSHLEGDLGTALTPSLHLHQRPLPLPSLLLPPPLGGPFSLEKRGPNTHVALSTSSPSLSYFPLGVESLGGALTPPLHLHKGPFFLPSLSLTPSLDGPFSPLAPHYLEIVGIAVCAPPHLHGPLRASSYPFPLLGGGGYSPPSYHLLHALLKEVDLFGAFILPPLHRSSSRSTRRLATHNQHHRTGNHTSLTTPFGPMQVLGYETGTYLSMIHFHFIQQVVLKIWVGLWAVTVDAGGHSRADKDKDAQAQGIESDEEEPLVLPLIKKKRSGYAAFYLA